MIGVDLAPTLSGGQTSTTQSGPERSEVPTPGEDGSTILAGFSRSGLSRVGGDAVGSDAVTSCEAVANDDECAGTPTSSPSGSSAAPGTAIG